MFRFFKKNSESSSSGESRQTLSSELSYVYDSHLRQSVKIATAEIDEILKSNKSPIESVTLNLNMEEECESSSSYDKDQFTDKVTSTPILSDLQKEGMLVDDITRHLGKQPSMLNYNQGAALKFQGGLSTAFRPPAASLRERPIRVVKL